MSHTDLLETIKAIGQTPETFRRDTPMLLKTLDNIEAIDKEIKSKTEATYQRGFMTRDQAE